MERASSPDRPGRPAQDELVVATLARAVTAMAGVLPPDTELVLHDLSRLPNSLVAISGNVTGRQVGDPVTDFLLAKLTAPDSPDHQSYPTRVPDGRTLLSETTLFRDAEGRPIAALCSNRDTSAWQAVHDALALVGGAPITPQPQGEITEGFPRDLDELRTTMLDNAVQHVGVPVELMHKRHKVQVVDDLRGQGYFTLRDAVHSAANRLGVSRFTIYNYLKELEADGDGESADAS